MGVAGCRREDSSFGSTCICSVALFYAAVWLACRATSLGGRVTDSFGFRNWVLDGFAQLSNVQNLFKNYTYVSKLYVISNTVKMVYFSFLIILTLIMLSPRVKWVISTTTIKVQCVTIFQGPKRAKDRQINNELMDF